MTCEHPNCISGAQYGFSTEYAKYCQIHKKYGMIHMHENKLCINVNCGVKCDKTALFSYPKYNCPLYCIKHKNSLMINKSPSFHQSNRELILRIFDNLTEQQRANIALIDYKQTVDYLYDISLLANQNLQTQKETPLVVLPKEPGTAKKQHIIRPRKISYSYCPVFNVFNLETAPPDENQRKKTKHGDSSRDNRSDIRIKDLLNDESIEVKLHSREKISEQLPPVSSLIMLSDLRPVLIPDDKTK